MPQVLRGDPASARRLSCPLPQRRGRCVFRLSPGGRARCRKRRSRRARAGDLGADAGCDTRRRCGAAHRHRHGARGELAQATNGLWEAVPLLAALLSLPTDGRYPPLNLTPQKRKERTLKALLAQMEGLAARQSLLMVVEDVHWIDPTSLELLDLTVERVPKPAGLADHYIPTGVHAALGRSSTGDAAQPQSPVSAATHRNDLAANPREGAADGDRRPDR